MNKITRKQAEERLALPVLSLEEAIKMLDKTYNLVYIDYRDQIEDPQDYQKIIEEGYPDWDINLDWPYEQQWESANYIMNELFEKYDIDEDEDEIRMTIMERDISDPCRQLIKNSPDFAVYYELGVETSGIYGDEKEDIQEILKALKTNKKHPSYKKIELMNGQASYGGNLVLMFNAEIVDFYRDPSKDPKYIVFEDPYIAIMDRFNGSGDFTQIKGTYTIPFDRKRLFADEAMGGYSLIGKVFGCNSRSVDCKYHMTNKPERKILN